MVARSYRRNGLFYQPTEDIFAQALSLEYGKIQLICYSCVTSSERKCAF